MTEIQEANVMQFYDDDKRLVKQVIYERMLPANDGYTLTTQHFDQGRLVRQDVHAVIEKGVTAGAVAGAF